LQDATSVQLMAQTVGRYTITAAFAVHARFPRSSYSAANRRLSFTEDQNV
jgi:hypothetical protein